MAVRLGTIIPPYHVNYSSPPAPTGVPFFLNNFAIGLLQLAIFDYEHWVTTDNPDQERELFCIDASVDDTRTAQGSIAMTTNNLYLVRAYFEGGENIDLIIQKSDKHEVIHLQIVTIEGSPAFEHNNTYQFLSLREANRLINRMEN